MAIANKIYGKICQKNIREEYCITSGLDVKMYPMESIVNNPINPKHPTIKNAKNTDVANRFGIFFRALSSF